MEDIIMKKFIERREPEYVKKFKHYILECMDYSDLDKEPTKVEKIEYIMDRFYSEYGWNIKKQGKKKAMKEWLQGLAINVAHYNGDILELARKLGALEKDNESWQREDTVLANYWDFLVEVIILMEEDAKAIREHNIPEVITEEYFEKAMGHPPVQDDLERSNCGNLEHMSCGWNYEENKPMCYGGKGGLIDIFTPKLKDWNFETAFKERYGREYKG